MIGLLSTCVGADKGGTGGEVLSEHLGMRVSE